jgi:hypothetical protein
LQSFNNLNNAVFWDVLLCGSCKNRRFGEMYHLPLKRLSLQEQHDATPQKTTFIIVTAVKTSNLNVYQPSHDSVSKMAAG